MLVQLVSVVAILLYIVVGGLIFLLGGFGVLTVLAILPIITMIVLMRRYYLNSKSKETVVYIFVNWTVLAGITIFMYVLLAGINWR